MTIDPKPASQVKVPAALRTLKLLQALGKASSPMTAQSLATRLGMPRSSVYQLLEVLASEGFVLHFPEERRWSLGIAAFELGSAYLRHDPLERLAQPLVERILSRLNRLESGAITGVVQLGVLNGNELLYLLKSSSTSLASTGLHSGQDVAVVTDVGVRLPAHLTASGRSILALLPKSQFRAIFPGGGDTPLLRRTDKGPATLRQLERHLKSELNQGYSVELGEVSRDFGSVAAAATNHLGLPIAAFAVTFRTDGLTDAESDNIQRQLATLVGEAARDLTKRLGAK